MGDPCDIVHEATADGDVILTTVRPPGSVSVVEVPVHTHNAVAHREVA